MICYFLKTIITFLFIFNIFICNSIACMLDLDHSNLENHWKHYNNLPLVEENHLKLKAIISKDPSSFQSFLEKVEDILTKLDIEQYVGLRLLHRHFILDKNQIMVEEYQNLRDIPSLVSSPYSIEVAKEKRALPASWILRQDDQKTYKFFPFETSTDPAVSQIIDKLKTYENFFDEMSGLLQSYKLNSFFSIAILKRESLIADRNQIYVEDNHRGKSIISLQNQWNGNDHEMIRTTWNPFYKIDCGTT